MRSKPSVRASPNIGLGTDLSSIAGIIIGAGEAGISSREIARSLGINTEPLKDDEGRLLPKAGADYWTLLECLARFDANGGKLAKEFGIVRRDGRYFRR